MKWWQDDRKRDYAEHKKLEDESYEMMDKAFYDPGNDSILSRKVTNQEAYEKWRKMHIYAGKKERKMYERDTKNLIELIKYRDRVSW